MQWSNNRIVYQNSKWRRATGHALSTQPAPCLRPSVIEIRPNTPAYEHLKLLSELIQEKSRKQVRRCRFLIKLRDSNQRSRRDKHGDFHGRDKLVALPNVGEHNMVNVEGSVQVEPGAQLCGQSAKSVPRNRPYNAGSTCQSFISRAADKRRCLPRDLSLQQSLFHDMGSSQRTFALGKLACVSC